MTSKNYLSENAKKTLDRLCAEDVDIFFRLHIDLESTSLQSHLNGEHPRVLPSINYAASSSFFYCDKPLSYDQLVSWSRSFHDICKDVERDRTFLQTLTGGRTFVTYLIIHPGTHDSSEEKYGTFYELYGQDLKYPSPAELMQFKKRQVSSLRKRMCALEDKGTYGDYLHIENMELLEGFRVVENGVSQQLFPSFDHYDSGTKNAALFLKVLETYATR